MTGSSLRERIDEVLFRVAKPARYIGGEQNSVRKPRDAVSVRFALAFPDVYEVGMSNLGLRILYHILNAQPDIAAERVFAPAPDMEAEMRRERIPLFSLESSLPVSDFDLVGFSLAYEMTYTTVLNMLDLAGIPVFSRDRSDGDPIIVAGGHCAANPEPMADFIDAFAIGDGEDVVLDIANAVRDHGATRANALEALSRIDGVYVPSIHGAVTPKPKVRARIALDFEHAAFPDKLVVPFTETVHDRVAVEIMRGCSRGCRFCQAGSITRPVRERSLETLCEQASTLLENTGYDEIALTSLSSADHSRIGELVTRLIDRHSGERVGVSLPSLRADAQCVHLAAEIQKVRKSGLTFAPEAGTQRLRDVINKNVTEEDLLSAVEAAVEHGWRRIKLYFMIGLPTETDEDIEGIGELVRRVIEVGRRHKRPLTINVTISPFVPKPHTPFERRAMDNVEELERRIALLRPMLKGKNISLSWHDPRCSTIEAALARGDSALGSVIHDAWTRGANLEQDSFDFHRWATAFAEAGLSIEHYADRAMPHDEPVPWDHVDVGMSPEFLLREDAKADRAETTPDCRFGNCSACGIRESLEALFGKHAPCPPAKPEHAERILSLSKDEECDYTRQHPSTQLETPDAARSARITLTFKKGDEVRWLGHLDLMRVFERTIRMSGIPVAYSQGFNPRARMSIASALPLGATADAELITIDVMKPADLGAAVRGLNDRLPDGISIVEGAVLPDTTKGPRMAASEFIADVALTEGPLGGRLRDAIARLLDRDELLSERKSGKGRKTVNLRPGIERLELLEESDSTASILMVLPHRQFTVKPAEIVHALSEYIEGLTLRRLHRRKLITEGLTPGPR